MPHDPQWPHLQHQVPAFTQPLLLLRQQQQASLELETSHLLGRHPGNLYHRYDSSPRPKKEYVIINDKIFPRKGLHSKERLLHVKSEPESI